MTLTMITEGLLKLLEANHYNPSTIKFYQEEPFIVEAPNFVDLKVIETEPGVKGDTATNTLKPATLETGVEVRVPLFINEGDLIQVDTRDGSYLARVKE